MTMPEQPRHERSHQWPGEPQPRLDDEVIGDGTTRARLVHQCSLVTPSSLEPGTRHLHEAMPFLDVFETQAMPVEGHHAEHQEPTLEKDLPGNRRSPQPLVLARTRHANERPELVVDAWHGGHGSPDLVTIRLDCGGERQVDRTGHTSVSPFGEALRQERSRKASAAPDCDTRHLC